MRAAPAACAPPVWPTSRSAEIVPAGSLTPASRAFHHRDMGLSADLIGTWRLLSREDRTSDGRVRIDPSLGADPVALLVYDAGGNFAAQFMKRDRSAPPPAIAAAPAQNNSRAVGGYDAYFGVYTVDDATSTVTQRLTGALAPGDVGMIVTREMHLEGGRLVIRLRTAAIDGEPVERTLVWERAA